MPPIQLTRLVSRLAFVAALGCAPAKQEPQPAQVDQPVGQDRRFSGYLRIQRASGPDSVRVEIINVDVRGGYSTDRLALPFEGTLVAVLEMGEVTTTIGGVRVERKQGQIWTVPPGVPMGLATGGDAAALQVTIVGR